MSTNPNLIGLLIAALGGTAIGLERQWSGHADGPSARFGGIRTFTMLGAIAGLCGWLLSVDFAVVAVVLLTGAVLIVGIAYAAASRHDIDATTEVAALVVIGAGVLAGIGSYRISSGIIALLTLLLVEKSRLHSLVHGIDDVALRAAVRFAVMALVVLPLLPAGPYGPLGGIRPRELWALVLFFSGLSFLGYLARRIAGPRQGYLIAGLLGGLISSTNVTLTFARLSRNQPSLGRDLAFGAVAANAMLFPRVVVATAVLNSVLVAPLIPYLIGPALVAAIATGLGARRASTASSNPTGGGHPLQLVNALQMATLFQLVLMAVHLSRSVWGNPGIFTSAALLGLTDVDALTVSMARTVALIDAPEIAAVAIAIGILSNTVLKLGLALVFGERTFRLVGAGILAAMVAAGAAPFII